MTPPTKFKSLFELIEESASELADYFSCIHIISAKLLVCPQTFLTLIKHIQELEILYEFDVRFHTKTRKSSLSCFTDCTKHVSAGALLFIDTRQLYWTFIQTKLRATTDINLFSLIGP